MIKIFKAPGLPVFRVLFVVIFLFGLANASSAHAGPLADMTNSHEKLADTQSEVAALKALLTKLTKKSNFISQQTSKKVGVLHETIDAQEERIKELEKQISLETLAWEGEKQGLRDKAAAEATFARKTFEGALESQTQKLDAVEIELAAAKDQLLKTEAEHQKTLTKTSSHAAEELATQLEAQMAEHQEVLMTQLATQIAEHEKTLEETLAIEKSHYEEEKRQNEQALVAEHAEKMRQLEQKLEAEFATVKVQHATAIKKAQTQLKEKEAASEKTRLALAAEHTTAIREEETKLATVKTQLTIAKAQHKEKLAAAKTQLEGTETEHAAAIKAAAIEFTEAQVQLTTAEADHQWTLKAAAERAAEVLKAQLAHQESLRQIAIKTAQTELEDKEAAFEKTRLALVAEHGKELATAEAGHTKKLAAAKTQHKKMLTETEGRAAAELTTQLAEKGALVTAQTQKLSEQTESMLERDTQIEKLMAQLATQDLLVKETVMPKLKEEEHQRNAMRTRIQDLEVTLKDGTHVDAEMIDAIQRTFSVIMRRRNITVDAIDLTLEGENASAAVRDRVKKILASAPDGEEALSAKEKIYSMDDATFMQETLDNHKRQAYLNARKTRTAAPVEYTSSLHSDSFFASSRRSDADEAEGIQQETPSRLKKVDPATLHAEVSSVCAGSKASAVVDSPESACSTSLVVEEAEAQKLKELLALRKLRKKETSSDSSSSFDLENSILTRSTGTAPSLSSILSEKEHIDGEA